MFKNIGRFFREYYQLGWVVVAIVAAIIFTAFGLEKVAHIILAATAIVNVIPLVWGMIQDLRHGTYGVDILAATAIITSVLLGEYWAGIIIVLMLTGGEALEDYAENRAKAELSALLERAPKQTHLVTARKVIDIAVSKVKVNDKLIIKPGEVVPVDAIILEGTSSFDESSLTGESLPVDKAVGDQLLSGSINTEGTITVKALHTAADSQYEQIIKLVKSATSSQSPFVRLADRYSIPFTAVSFIIAGGAWAMSGDVMRFLQVLVVATPCPLILGAPIAIISGMSRAAKSGIIIKNGTAMEQLADVRTVAFDKTGTLTVGQPTVESIITYGKTTKNEVLRLAATLEQNSNHVLAKAIVDEAERKKIKLPKTKNVREVSGHGLSGTIERQSVLVAKHSYMKDKGITMPKELKVASLASTASFVAVDNQLVGAITFADEVREESKLTLQALKKLGIKKTLMVTGDNYTIARKIAKKLGISDVVADSLPGDKLVAIQNLKDKPVAFVGDGVNDAPVLTASDVGIALGARGSTAASETADVVIMLDDLNKVPQSIRISKDTLRIARQAILIGIFISIGLMLVYSTGKFSPASGAAIQELVDITVIIYALRAHGPWQRKSKRVVQPATT